MTPQAPALNQVNLSSSAFWSIPRAERETYFAQLRRAAPVSWQSPPEASLGGELLTSSPYWAVVSHEHVRKVSRDPEMFCSGRGVNFQDVPPEVMEAFTSFLAMDAPRHTKLRKLVSTALTPREVRRVNGLIEQRARRVVDDLLEVGDCDFVTQVSMRLPSMMLWDMWGVYDEDERARLTEAVDTLIGSGDPDIRGGRSELETIGAAVEVLMPTSQELAQARRRSPGDDLMSNLVMTEVDGERLTDLEICAFFTLLAIAGNDTTRHTTSLAMRALTEFPDQRRILLEDPAGRMETAVEEFLRWGSPVATFRRTATCDTELGGQQIAEGDRVVMFYQSANRDEQAFENADTFDVRREPNPHVAFGGGGPHFCLGNQLARAQLRALFTQLLTRAPDLEVGEPVELVGNVVNGIKEMPCTIRQA